MARDVAGTHTRIASVRAFSIGPDLMGLPRSYDVAVVADFNSLDDVRFTSNTPSTSLLSNWPATSRIKFNLETTRPLSGLQGIGPGRH
jgi:hypothetical protein